MDPVSNANRIAMLLRQRLQERSKPAAAARSGRAAGDTARKSGVRSADAIEELDDRRLRRALVENILTDQLGSALINDAKFQQVVDQVTEAIEGDSDGAVILSKVVADLRAGTR